jgi:hypothetical protein
MNLNDLWPANSGLQAHKPYIKSLVEQSCKPVNAETDFRELAGENPEAQLAADAFMKVPAAIRGSIIIALETEDRRQ